ncbi:UNVERIFIED_ORG: hypothetical protein EDC93_11279 [Bacillus cereus]
MEGNEEDGQLIVITGSWVQAVGSVVSLIGQIKEEGQEIEEKNYKELNKIIFCATRFLISLQIRNRRAINLITTTV